MPKFDADTLFDPIEITLDKKKYEVPKVTQGLLDAAGAIGKEGEDEQNILARQVAVLLGAEADAFIKTDIRKLGAIAKFFFETVTGELEGISSKNAVATVEKPTG